MPLEKLWSASLFELNSCRQCRLLHCAGRWTYATLGWQALSGGACVTLSEFRVYVWLMLVEESWFQRLAGWWTGWTVCSLFGAVICGSIRKKIVSFIRPVLHYWQERRSFLAQIWAVQRDVIAGTVLYETHGASLLHDTSVTKEVRVAFWARVLPW